MKFTIRDLLWLTLLAAVLVAWWVDRSRLAAAYVTMPDGSVWSAEAVEENFPIERRTYPATR